MFEEYLHAQVEVLREALARVDPERQRQVVVVCGRGLSGVVGNLLVRQCLEDNIRGLYSLGPCRAGNGLPSACEKAWRSNARVTEMGAAEWAQWAAMGDQLLLLDCTGCYTHSESIDDTLLAHLEHGVCPKAIVLAYGPPAGVELDNVDFDWSPYALHGYRGIVPTGFPTACEFSPSFCDLDPQGKLTDLQQPVRATKALQQLNLAGTYPDAPALSSYSLVTAERCTASLTAYSQEPGSVLSRLSRHKDNMGRVLIVAGSPTMCGAMLLATQGALASGAGVVEVVTPKALHPQLNVCHPEAITHDAQHAAIPPEVLDAQGKLKSSYQSILIGPGLGREPALRENILAWLRLADGRPVVLDADALYALSPLEEALAGPLQAFIRCPLILTPHLGEFHRLFPAVSSRSAIDERARRLAGRTSWTLVLKQASTRVYYGTKVELLRNPRVPGMATGGSGDVLAGFLSGLLAWSHRPSLAAPMAIYLHAMSARLVQQEIGDLPMTASRIADRLPAALHSILAGASIGN